MGMSEVVWFTNYLTFVAGVFDIISRKREKAPPRTPMHKTFETPKRQMGRDKVENFNHENIYVNKRCLKCQFPHSRGKTCNWILSLQNSARQILSIQVSLMFLEMHGFQRSAVELDLPNCWKLYFIAVRKVLMSNMLDNFIHS